MTVAIDREIIYPDSDGQPMADNTEQFQKLTPESCCFFTVGKLLSWFTPSLFGHSNQNLVGIFRIF